MKKILSLLLMLAMLLSSFSVHSLAEEKPLHPVRIVQPGNLPEKYEEGIKAVNESLLADGYDIQVEVIRIPWGEYDAKLNVMLADGEPFELLHVMQDVKNMSALASMGAIIPIDEYLDKYPNLVARFSDTEWLGALYNGKHYAVPCYWRSFDNTMSYFNLRTDVMKAVGYDAFPTNSVDDVLNLMKKSQDYILEETGIKAYNWFHQNQDTAHWLHRTYDSYPFYVENSLGIVLARQDGTIDSFYESEEFKKDAETYYRMYQAGLVNPDVLNLDHSVMYDDAKLGGFLPSQTFDPATSVSIKRNTGMDVEVNWVEMNPEKPEMIYTFVQNLNAISSTSEDPESGLKFLDWLYSSKENHDLFHYGIEGVHYTPVGDNKIKYVLTDGGDFSYYMDTWMTGYLPYIRFESDAPDSQIDFMTYKAENKVVSPVAGFIFDASNVQTELNNLQTEIIASIYPIKVGMVSYEDNINRAIANLKAAGLDKYLDEYRTQFAVYLEANPWALESAE